MTIRRKKNMLHFTVHSLYLHKPAKFAVRRMRRPTQAERRTLEKEIELAELFARDEEDTFTRDFRQIYTERLRSAFSHVLRGLRHVSYTVVKTTKYASRLNEAGENDYAVTSESRNTFLKWVR